MTQDPFVADAKVSPRKSSNKGYRDKKYSFREVQGKLSSERLVEKMALRQHSIETLNCFIIELKIHNRFKVQLPYER